MFKLLRFFIGPPPMNFATKKLRRYSLMRGYQFWEDPEFRKCVDYDAQEEEEQNRIYNEVIVTTIALVVLLLDSMSKLPKNEKSSDKLDELKDGYIENYIAFLRESKIPEQNVDLWRKLINLRLDEYKGHMREYKKYLVNEMEWFQVVLTGGFHHIRRQQPLGKDDPLFKLMQTWFRVLSNDLVKLINELM